MNPHQTAQLKHTVSRPSSLAELQPELAANGRTSTWAKYQASLSHCTIVVGYSETTDPIGNSDSSVSNVYNSALIVNKDGEVAGNIRQQRVRPSETVFVNEGGFSGPFSLTDNTNTVHPTVVGISDDIWYASLSLQLV